MEDVPSSWSTQLFDQSELPKLIFDLETLRFVEVNCSAVRRYGYSRDEFLSLSVADLRPPEDVPALLDAIRGPRSSARASGQWRHRTRDGTLLFVDVFAEDLTFAGRPARMVTVADARAQPAGESTRVEDQLRRSAEYYRLIVETAAEGIWIVDAARCTTFVNQRLVEILGYPLSEMLGRPLWAWMDEESAARCRETFARPSPPISGQLEYACVRKDGGQVRLRFSISPMRDSDGHGVAVLAMVTDVTRSHLGDELLRASERRFRALIEHAHDMIVTQTKGRTVASVSPSVARVLGYTVVEYAGCQPEELIHPDDAARMAANYLRVLENPGVPMPARYRMRHKDGSFRWIHGVAKNLLDEPSVGAVVVNEHDDTERTTAEEALRASERRFRTLIEGGPDAIGVLAGGRAVYANPRLGSMLGYDVVEAQMRTAEFVDPDERGEMKARVALIMAGEKLAPRVFTLLRGSGERLRAEVTQLPIDWEGEPALLSVFRDVTEREHIDARLMLADRVASIGTLAAGVAHEINNPLAYVLANLTYAREQAEAQPALGELAEALREAQVGAERVRGIVRDLKTLSRPDEGKSGMVDVHRALDMSVSMAWNEIRHRARLVKDYALDLPQVTGNEGRLGQVFLNLLINAAHSIREGSADSNEIRVTTRAEGGRVIVEVRDTGSGIAREHKKRLFDPFFTTKPQGVGTGLGLSICHTIVTGLGGEIGFESEPGKGTIFRVALPAGAVAQQPVAPPAKALPEERRGRVLVVDDEPLVAKCVVRALQKHHDVVAVTRAPDALKLLNEAAVFDVIFCDLMMPEMTGIEFHERLTRDLPAEAAKVVFLTGGAFTERAQTFLGGVKNQTLTKPFDLAELRRFVQARIPV